MGVRDEGPGRPARRVPAAALAALLVALVAFAGVAWRIARFGRFAFDAQLLALLHAQHSPALTWMARASTTLGSGWPIVIGTLLLVFALTRGRAKGAPRRWRDAGFLLAAVGGSAALNDLAKAAFAWPRPELFPHLVVESGFTFPSGHAMNGAALLLAVLLVAGDAWPSGRRGRAGFRAVLVALALAIGASRPYLQVHYPSDVLAGWALGVAWVLAVRLAVRLAVSRRRP